MRDVQSLPVLFDRVGAFLNRLADLQEKWEKLTPDMRIAEIERIFSHASPSPVDGVLSDYQMILDIMYDATSRSCPSAKTKMYG